MRDWAEIIEDALWLPHQQKLWVSKEDVMHPQEAGIPYSYFAYRKTVHDGRAIDIKLEGDYWSIHWDWHLPDTYLIGHALDDAPLEWLLTTTGVGATLGVAFGSRGKNGAGVLYGAGMGLGFGLLMLLFRAIDRNNQGDYRRCH